MNSSFDEIGGKFNKMDFKAWYFAYRKNGFAALEKESAGCINRNSLKMDKSESSD